MTLWIAILVIAGLVGLWAVDRWIVTFNPLAWAAAWWVACYAIIRFGIEPPAPSSLIWAFMSIISLALLAYLTASTERMEAAKGVLVRFMVEDRYTIPLLVIALLIPALVAVRVYLNATARPQAPGAGRTIHPPPPSEIQFEGETMNLTTAVNPYRELEESDPEAFAEHVANGRRVYYENCVYCHGDNMAGEGQYAHGFSPLPANFQDSGTIAQLQESYLFWRIAKGGPGLPDESQPWNSAMPAWEGELSKEEIWEVILFLYEYTGHEPRKSEAAE
jgi:mono/diheme cytochrome c family protein